MAREAVAEQDDHQGGTYRLELVSCGKDRCTRCAGGPAHGPYWYRYYRGRGGKVVSKYVGKTLPAGAAAGLAGPALDQAVARAEEAGHARQAEIQGQVARAIAALMSDPDDPWAWGEFVSIADLRRKLPSIPHAELDTELDRMYRAQQVNLIPRSDPRALTNEDRGAAITVNGENKNLISVPNRHPTGD